MKTVCGPALAMEIVLASMALSMGCGCRKIRTQNLREANIPINRYNAQAPCLEKTPSVRLGRESSTGCGSHGLSAPLTFMDEAVSNLATRVNVDFSLDTAVAFSEAVALRMKTEKREYIRTGLFMEYSACISQMIIPRLAGFEDGVPLEKMQVASNDFAVIGCLIERAWQLGADPQVGIPLAFNELSRIRYARRYEAFWRVRNETLANLYSEHARRLERLVEADDGPVKKDFDKLCRMIETRTSNTVLPRTAADRWNAKKRHLDTVNAALGHYPAWARHWLRDNPQANNSKY